MSERRRMFYLLLNMTIVAVVVGVVSIRILYHAAFDEQKTRLTEIVQSQARLIEAIARHEQYKVSVPGETAEEIVEDTLGQIREAHENYAGFGETGEFTLAQREGDNIVFLLSHRHGGLSDPEPVPFDSALAEPQRRALSGDAGTVVGLDYRGETVLAAYEPVTGLDMGIVAKIDLAEVRAPFYRAALFAGLISMVIIFSGAFVFRRISNPVIEHLEKSLEALQESEKRFRRYILSAPYPLMIHAEGTVIELSHIWTKITGYTLDEIPTIIKWTEFAYGKDAVPSKEFIDKLYDLKDLQYDGEWEIKIKDGSTRIWDFSTSPIGRLADGSRAVISIAVDVTERKEIQERSQRQLQRISALHEIDMAITSSLDIRLTLSILINQVINQLDVDAATMFLVEPSQSLKFATGQGFRDLNSIRGARLRIGDSLAGRVALERQTIHVPDLREFKIKASFAGIISREGFAVYYGVPLIAKGQLVGVLEIYHRSPLDPDAEWLDFLETLAGQAAIAVHDAILFEDLQKANVDMEVAYASTLEGWVQALDMRDQETEGHTQRVTELAIRLASFMEIAPEELIHITRGALLHDIGKMGVPDEILHKPGPLTDEEWVIMKQHPIFARNFLAGIKYLSPALEIPYSHHEKWEGSGYPQGLKGEQIPLSARMFAVVDVWDALRSDRPYRKAWSREKTIDYIRDQSGTHFDPEVVEAFLELINSDKD